MDDKRHASLKAARAKYYQKNKKEAIARAKKWVEDNRERDRAGRRKSNETRYIKRRHREVQNLYGLSAIAHVDMLARQNFKCALIHCNVRVDIYSPIDHDHETGKSRGILCKGHNLALGIFEKNKACLLDAFAYLKTPVPYER